MFYDNIMSESVLIQNTKDLQYCYLGILPSAKSPATCSPCVRILRRDVFQLELCAFTVVSRTQAQYQSQVRKPMLGSSATLPRLSNGGLLYCTVPCGMHFFFSSSVSTNPRYCIVLVPPSH